MTTHYVRNETGAIHSVDEDHFLERLHDTTRSGRRVLKPEFEEITEAEARAGNPQLFGAPDPETRMTAAEIKELRERRAFEAELAAEQAEYEASLTPDDETETSAETERPNPRRR